MRMVASVGGRAQAASVMCTLFSLASAQASYPSRPVRIIMKPRSKAEELFRIGNSVGH